MYILNFIQGINTRHLTIYPYNANDTTRNTLGYTSHSYFFPTIYIQVVDIPSQLYTGILLSEIFHPNIIPVIDDSYQIYHS